MQRHQIVDDTKSWSLIAEENTAVTNATAVALQQLETTSSPCSKISKKIIGRFQLLHASRLQLQEFRLEFEQPQLAQAYAQALKLPASHHLEHENSRCLRIRLTAPTNLQFSGSVLVARGFTHRLNRKLLEACRRLSRSPDELCKAIFHPAKLYNLSEAQEWLFFRGGLATTLDLTNELASLREEFYWTLCDANPDAQSLAVMAHLFHERARSLVTFRIFEK